MKQSIRQPCSAADLHRLIAPKVLMVAGSTASDAHHRPDLLVNARQLLLADAGLPRRVSAGQ
ncbi:MAG TPA: hypothetical protein VFC16_01455 [Nakamurella sp.]|nr:hypothetical protein [Nakamurella sp.]